MKRSNAFAGLLGVMMMTSCGEPDVPARTGTAAGPVTRVSVVDAQKLDVPVFYETPGTVRAQTAATLASKILGYIQDVKVQPGDRVRAGQLMAVIDSRDLDSALAAARAAEQETRSAIAEADNGIAAAKAQLGLTRVTFRRMQDLFRKTSISNQEFDEAEARLRTAEAAYQMAVSKRAQLDSKIAQARQAVQSASVMHSYSDIRAPFDGTVSARATEPGQMATPGAPMFTIEKEGSFRFEAPVEESMLRNIHLGDVVSISIDAADRTVDARVTEIVPTIDPASRAFLVKASLPAIPSIRSGLFGRMQVRRGVRQGIVVPADAIGKRGDLESVFVVENGVAHLRMITSVALDGARAEILSGLEPGEKVISPRPLKLADGTKVETRNGRT